MPHLFICVPTRFQRQTSALAWIRRPTDFSTAHLHFGSESIVPMLFPLSSHIPRVFVCQILGKLLGLTHSTNRLWRNTLAQMCLSSFLPSLYALRAPSFSPSLCVSVTQISPDSWLQECSLRFSAEATLESLCDVNYHGVSENSQKTLVHT